MAKSDPESLRSDDVCLDIEFCFGDKSDHLPVGIDEGSIDYLSRRRILDC